MDFLDYRHKFIEKATSSGYSLEVIERCLTYAKPLIETNLPVIYNHSHLASLVGYNINYLLRAAKHTKFFYREFKILKKNKRVRTIFEPLTSLKEIQRWILTEILYEVEVSKFSKAYLPRTTIKQNLVFHRNMPKVLKLDITDFFSSITKNSVRKLFYSLGYSAALSNLLSKLCCLEDTLPQGAPTSPYLSNLYLKNFDEQIGAFCLDRKIRYTRYADDLTFSGLFDEDFLVDFVKNQLNGLKLTLNAEKTVLMKKNDRQIVTGIVVNEKLQVERSKRKSIRQKMFYIKLFGIENHKNKLGIKKENYLEHLLGQINFILFINQDDKEFLGYKEELLKIKSINNDNNQKT